MSPYITEPAVPGMGTVHANSAREALTKVCILPAAGRGDRLGGVRRTDRRRSGRPGRARRRGRARVAPGGEIVAVPGRAEYGVVETARVFAERDGALTRVDGFPPPPERFARIGVEIGELLRRTPAGEG